jgi:hypothetical protein
MKRVMMVTMAAALIWTAVPSAQAQQQRGGFLGLIAGCCLGVRTSGAYNAGKEIHWREWIRVVVPLVPQIWDGLEGARGMTTADYAKQYGSMYY